MLPREIKAEHWPERTLYDLPPRPLGRLRYIGLLPAGFAVAFAWMPLRQIVSSLRTSVEGDSGGMEWFLVVFLSLFVLAALIPFGLGMFIMAGRTRIIAEGGTLRILEIAGPIRRSRKIPFSDVLGLEVAGTGKQHAPGAAWARLGALSATVKTGRKRLVLVGYPLDWLEPVAEELSGLMRLKGTSAPVTRVEADPLAPSQQEEARTVSRPPDTQVVLSTRANGIELVIPPVGLRKGVRSAFTFGIVWCVFVGIIGTIAVLAERKHSLPMPLMIFLTVFMTIGGGMISGALHMARRRLAIVADRFCLRVEQVGPFGKRNWEWQKSEITSIRADKSGTEINNVPLYELQVHASNRKKVGLMGGRPEDELRWIAFELRKMLGAGGSRPGQEAL